MGTDAVLSHPRAVQRHGASLFLRRDGVQQTFFVAPACLLLLGLTVYPFVYSVYLSLHRVRLTNLTRSRFVGLDNYANLLRDGLFIHSLINTATLAVVSITLETILGFIVAKIFMGLGARRWVNVLRSLYLLPMMITPLTVGVIFAYILNPTIGIMNYLLHVLDVPPVSWFGSPGVAMLAIVLINVWQFAPFMMLLILAALLSIRSDLYEAARVDGARWHHIVRRIEIPSILGVVLLGAILRVIDILRYFDVIYVTPRGGPGDSTMVLTLYAYQQDVQYFQIGAGSAASVLILVASIVVTTFAVRLLRRIEA